MWQALNWSVLDVVTIDHCAYLRESPELVPSADGLVDEVYKAGFELALETGVLYATTTINEGRACSGF